MPISTPHSMANANPTNPSKAVTCVAGHSVGHASMVALTIWVGEENMLCGTLPIRTHASHTASSAITAVTVARRSLIVAFISGHLPLP